MASIKEARKFMGFTQKELSEKSGINLRQLQKYESGECNVNNMTAENAKKLSDALGCTIGQLLDIDLSIFSDEAKKSLREGDLTLSELYDMSKYQKVKKLSKIGRLNATFSACYNRITDGIFEKLQPDDLAQLVDAFYDCYSDGKAEGRKED